MKKFSILLEILILVFVIRTTLEVPFNLLSPSIPSPGTSNIAVPDADPPTDVKSFLKSRLANWYKSTGKGLNVPILMYHNLLDGSPAGDSLNVSAKAFEDQMRELNAHGYHTIFFEQLYDHYMDGSPLPENPIIITFDDGYKSNYTIGYPILKKYNMNACIFMISNAIGDSNYMSTDELKDAAASGILEIQSHSVSHDKALSVAEDAQIRKELSDSKSKLETITGKTVNVFSYPYGIYSEAFVKELILQGYIFSVTINNGCANKNDNPFILGRIRVYGSDTGKILRDRIEMATGRKT